MLKNVLVLIPLLRFQWDLRTCFETWKHEHTPRAIFSEPLYCVSTMIDARYKDRYFDTDKKQGLREMLDTAGQDGNGHSDSEAPRKRGHGQTELKLHCLSCMKKSWLRMKQLNKLTMKQHSK